MTGDYLSIGNDLIDNRLFCFALVQIKVIKPMKMIK